MTLYEFNDADEAEQLEAVWAGTHIADRQMMSTTFYYTRFLVFMWKYITTGNIIL